jgi:hypothetical protein
VGVWAWLKKFVLMKRVGVVLLVEKSLASHFQRAFQEFILMKSICVRIVVLGFGK